MNTFAAPKYSVIPTDWMKIGKLIKEKWVVFYEKWDKYVD